MKPGQNTPLQEPCPRKSSTPNRALPVSSIGALRLSKSRPGEKTRRRWSHEKLAARRARVCQKNRGALRLPEQRFPWRNFRPKRPLCGSLSGRLGRAEGSGDARAACGGLRQPRGAALSNTLSNNAQSGSCFVSRQRLQFRMYREGGNDFANRRPPEAPASRTGPRD